MGIHASPPLEDGSRYVLCYGKVTRDARNTVTPSKAIPKCEFGIAYDRKKFMNVLALGDNEVTRTASALEYGDYVLVGGVWKEKPYTNKHGEEKVYSELRAEIVIPQPSLSSAVQAQTGKKHMDDSPDAFESANDDGWAEESGDDSELPF